MRKRPIEPLLAGLRALGVDAVSREGTGCPPVVVRADGLPGGRARMRGDISSQYFSALLLAAPYARRDVEIEVEGELVSAPYITMTMSTMTAFGDHTHLERAVEAGFDLQFTTPVDSHEVVEQLEGSVRASQRYQARGYVVEPDASGAS